MRNNDKNFATTAEVDKFKGDLQAKKDESTKLLI